MVIQVRIELTSPAYQAGALPLSYWTMDWRSGSELHAHLKVQSLASCCWTTGVMIGAARGTQTPILNLRGVGLYSVELEPRGHPRRNRTVVSAL